MARQRILEAAALIASDEGAQSLSLERVAERAGVSKGGLLYHFRTKEALLAGMIESVMAEHDEAIGQLVSSGVPYYQAMIDKALSPELDQHNLMSAFIAAVATDPGLADMVKEHKADWAAKLASDGLTPVQCLLFEFVLDGLFVGRTIRVTDVDERKANLLRSGLTRITSPTPEEQLAALFQAILPLAEASEPLAPT